MVGDAVGLVGRDRDGEDRLEAEAGDDERDEQGEQRLRPGQAQERPRRRRAKPTAAAGGRQATQAASAARSPSPWAPRRAGPVSARNSDRTIDSPTTTAAARTRQAATNGARPVMPRAAARATAVAARSAVPRRSGQNAVDTPQCRKIGIWVGRGAGIPLPWPRTRRDRQHGGRRRRVLLIVSLFLDWSNFSTSRSSAWHRLRGSGDRARGARIGGDCWGGDSTLAGGGRPYPSVPPSWVAAVVIVASQSSTRRHPCSTA